MIWLQFIACSAIVLFSGAKLSQYGDIIAEKTGLGRTLIGVALLAFITSLPEFITGISSVTIFVVPDIAVGNVLGACMIDILIIALLDVFGGSALISTQLREGHVLTASFGILLLGLVGIGILAGEQFPVIGWVSLNSVFLILIYFVALRMVFLYEKRKITGFVTEMAEELKYKQVSMKRALLMFAINSILILIAAVYLPLIGEEIAVITGLGETFVGSVFIAITTTLPELAVSIAALRIGAVDMAVGNLFGSVLFNILILAVVDVFYSKGSIFSSISGNHIIAVISTITMIAIAMIGMIYRFGKKFFFFAWDSTGIIFIYIFSLFLLYAKK